jgi:hypothetical protein
VEDEEEEEEGAEAAGEQDISTKICAHEQALHCISEIMQFAIDSSSSSLLELLYAVKCCIQNDMITKKVETSFFVGSMEEISLSCILETYNVQCNRALICTLIMYYILLLLYYFNNIGL